MRTEAVAKTEYEKVVMRKKQAIRQGKIVVHNYRYSDELHGYTVLIGETLHVILNERKSEREKLRTHQELVRLAYCNPDKALALIYGKDRKTLLAPYAKGKTEINIFQLKDIIENLHIRGVQENDQPEKSENTLY